MRSILVVEDEFDVQEVVADVLRDEGYDVAVCGNGREALEALKQKPPDVVRMDVMLPLLSGLQVIERMRQTSGLESIPVVLMSEVPPRTPAAPAWQGFIKKPFKLEHLLAAVARACGSA